MILFAVIISNIFLLSHDYQTGYACTTVTAIENNVNCVNYDRIEKSITITCKSANLTEINDEPNNLSILSKRPNGVWLLNAGLVIEKGATLNIDSKDTKWLKIIADGKIAYGIHVLGSLKIDSVKITSWNPETNNYAITNQERSQERLSIQALLGHISELNLTQQVLQTLLTQRLHILDTRDDRAQELLVFIIIVPEMAAY